MSIIAQYTARILDPLRGGNRVADHFTQHGNSAIRTAEVLPHPVSDNALAIDRRVILIAFPDIPPAIVNALDLVAGRWLELAGLQPKRPFL